MTLTELERRAVEAGIDWSVRWATKPAPQQSDRLNGSIQDRIGEAYDYDTAHVLGFALGWLAGRAEAIQECAKVCDVEQHDGRRITRGAHAASLAHKIRALDGGAK